jgi:DNA primase
MVKEKICYKDAEKIFYNLDNIATEDTCVIVEGEFDVLSYLSAGVTNVVSVLVSILKVN